MAIRDLLAETLVGSGSLEVGDVLLNNAVALFAMQDEDSDADADPTTPERIFVCDNNFGIDVNVGDAVRVQGDVTEYLSLTEMTNVDNVLLCPSVGGSASAASVSLPFASSTYLERYEGILKG
jgi:predicted extracellular nuclease